MKWWRKREDHSEKAPEPVGDAWKVLEPSDPRNQSPAYLVINKRLKDCGGIDRTQGSE